MEPTGETSVEGEVRSDLVELSPSLWKAGPPYAWDNDWWSENDTFDDMEDLRRCGFQDDGPDASRLTSVGVSRRRYDSETFVLQTSFRSRGGEGVSFRRVEGDTWGAAWRLAESTIRVYVDLTADEVLSGILGFRHTFCGSDDSDDSGPVEPVFRVLNTRTGETTLVGRVSSQSPEDSIVLEAPPGFCIAAFHGTMVSSPFALGLYFRRFAPSWIDRSPAIPLSQRQVYPPAFAAEHSGYLQAKQEKGTPISTLSSDVDNAILSRLLEMHMACPQWRGGLVWAEIWKRWGDGYNGQPCTWAAWEFREFTRLEWHDIMTGRREGVQLSEPHAKEWLREERELRRERSRWKAARRRGNGELAKKASKENAEREVHGLARKAGDGQSSVVS